MDGETSSNQPESAATGALTSKERVMTEQEAVPEGSGRVT